MGRGRNENNGSHFVDSSQGSAEVSELLLEQGKLEVSGGILLDVGEQRLDVAQHLIGALIEVVLGDQFAKRAIATLHLSDKRFALGGQTVQPLVQLRVAGQTS